MDNDASKIGAKKVKSNDEIDVEVEARAGRVPFFSVSLQII